MNKTAILIIDAQVNPRAVTVSRILQYVRRGRIRAVHEIHDGAGEIIEAEDIVEFTAEPDLLEAFDISPQLRLKALMLSLGAALTLYDNYLIGAVQFEQDERLRRIINDPDMGFGLAANKLAEAAQIIEDYPMALQLRYLQTMREMAAENNSTTIFPLPIDLFRPLLKLMDNRRDA